MAEQQPGAHACTLEEIEDGKSAPAFFTCRSGELLWGQLHTVIAGFASAQLDTELGPPEESDGGAPAGGGTVSASSFQYKVAACKGEWKVEAAFLDDSEGRPWHLGFVCHHVDVDGVQVLKGAAEAGLGGNGKFADLDIVFVDRYDWSGSSSPGFELIVQAVEGKEVDAEEDGFEDVGYYPSLVHGRFMLVDPQSFSNLLQALKDGKRIEQKSYLIRNIGQTRSSFSASTSSGDEILSAKCENFGIHLVVDHSEYDMGWMAFQSGKLVGFVYDGAYSALEGDNLRIGSSKITTES